MKHPLVRALGSVGLTADDVAARLGVDPKTVQRWLTGRVPYPRHRSALIELTGWLPNDLWPGVARPVEPETDREVRVTYPQRSAVPADAWRRLFDRATRDIGILAYSALFLAEDAAVQRLLVRKARSGVRVRIVLGDPDGVHVAQRGADEGIDTMMAARIRNAFVLFRPLTTDPGIRVRLHDTVLYNSIYLGDDEAIINTHVYGCAASRAPVLHLRRQRGDDGMAATYFHAFERIWESARDATC